MPELPEVENVVRQLSPCLIGQQIDLVKHGQKNLRYPFPTPNTLRELQKGTITEVRRRAKYIVITVILNNQNHTAHHLSDSTSPVASYLFFHLGMTGRLTYRNATSLSNAAPFITGYGADSSNETDPHVHVEISLLSGARLIFRDPRRFGLFTVIGPTASFYQQVRHSIFADRDPEANLAPVLNQSTEDDPYNRLWHGILELGPEPLSNAFTASYLLNAIHSKGHKTLMKQLLMDNSIVVGIGNIYANEILFDSGILPTAAARSMTEAQVQNVIRSSRYILLKAIDNGGSTLQDYRDANNRKGSFQNHLQVYGRATLPCFRCHQVIVGIKLNGRATFYCLACQS